MAGRCLILVDMQLDFLEPGAPLEVPGGVALAPRLAAMAWAAAAAGALVAATQDWHPPGHVSFAPSHPSHAPGDVLRPAPNSSPALRLFPPHCVAGSPGAELASPLRAAPLSLLLRKGQHPGSESLSAFGDAVGRPTGLAAWLRGRGVGELAIAGVATEFCVLMTALDGIKEGFEVVIMADGVAGVDPGAAAAALAAVQAAGARVEPWSAVLARWRGTHEENGEVGLSG